MTIFLTGASGYIGHALTLKLLEQGSHVTLYTRSELEIPARYSSQVTIRKGELLDAHALEKAMEGCTHVYHLAACAKVWTRDSHEFDRINVQATELLLRTAVRTKIRKVVVTSTAGVLGPAHDPQPVTEDTVRRMPFFSAYERTKEMAENICWRFASEGLHVVVVNPSRVYGSGKATQSNAISRLLRMLRSGRFRFIPGNGKRTGNYVYLNDVVNGHLLAMEHGGSGERYILGGENRTYDEFFCLAKDLLGVRHRLYHLPLFVMMAFGRLEYLKAKLFGIPPMITPNWVKKYLYDWPLDSSKAIRELGYSITSLEAGLKETIRQMEQE